MMRLLSPDHPITIAPQPHGIPVKFAGQQGK
jgi:hypothetical protein